MAERPTYPTWIKPFRIKVFWAITVAILVASGVVAAFWPPGLALAVLCLPFAYIATVITVSAWRLSPRGDDLQAAIHQLVVDAVGPGGRLLDIGCGSSQLLVRFAGAEPGEYVGLDSWPGDWGQYAKAQAERNAELENVPDIDFVSGSASHLPFHDGAFDRVVSSLTFHEVADTPDKTVGVREAVRVLRPGGRFAFVDLFDDPSIYRGRSRVLDAIAEAGGDPLSVRALSELLPLRWPMNTRKVLKDAVLIVGTTV